MKFSLLAAPRTVVYHDKILCPLDELGDQRRVPLRRSYFATVGSYSVKTAADRYRHAAYYNKH